MFLSDYMKKDMLEKGRATVSFKKDEPVPIWTGKKDDAEHPYQRYEVKATDLTHSAIHQPSRHRRVRLLETCAPDILG